MPNLIRMWTCCGQFWHRWLV